MNTDPLWYKDAVFYEVFVRAFADSNGDGIGDLAGLTAKLDYLQWLGVDAVWMLPIFPSPLRDDGYDVADYCAVHPDYGTLDDVRRLIEEAHRRDLRIIVELIPNHTSDQNAWFQASRDPNHPEHAKYRDWYVWSDTDQKYLDTRIIFLDTEPSNWTFDPLRGQYFWHRFLLTPARSELRQPGRAAGHAPCGSVLVGHGRRRLPGGCHALPLRARGRQLARTCRRHTPISSGCARSWTRTRPARCSFPRPTCGPRTCGPTSAAIRPTPACPATSST